CCLGYFLTSIANLQIIVILQSACSHVGPVDKIGSPRECCEKIEPLLQNGPPWKGRTFYPAASYVAISILLPHAGGGVGGEEEFHNPLEPHRSLLGAVFDLRYPNL